MTQINILPYLIEAFGHNRRIYPDIDRLYETRKYEFYQLATSSEWYNHQIVAEGDIYHEEYAKKALGIILYIVETQDREIQDKFYDIIRKGWTRAYMYVRNHDVVSFEKYFSNMSHIKNDDDANTESAVLYFLAQNAGKTIEHNEHLKLWEDVTIMRLEHYKLDHPLRYNYETIEPDVLKHIKSLKDRVYGKYGVLNSYDALFDTRMHEDMRNNRDQLSLLCDTEFVSISSLFNNVKITERDVEEVLGLYFMHHKNKNAEAAGNFLVAGLMLKGLLKAYRQVKEHFFANNRETMLLEMRRQDDKIEQLTGDNVVLKRKAESLESQVKSIRDEVEEQYTTQVRGLEARVRELEIELAREKQKDGELNALREFIFSLNTEAEPGVAEKEFDFTGVRGVIFGGHERWRKRMKELLPGFVFISSESFDVRLLDDADVVLFFVGYMGHKLYDKAIAEARKHGLKVGYISSINDRLALGEIEKILRRK